MRTRNLFIPIVCAIMLASSAGAHISTPTDSTRAGGTEAAQKKNKTKNVPPCSSHDNGDTVVTNDCGHQGDASVTPATGTATTSTTIQTDNHFEGSITGLDSNDKLICGPNNKVNVSASGGSIELKGGSTLTLNVLATQGSTNVTVKLPNSVTMSVGPGSNVVITTPG